jgi:hypothetical protein
MSTSIFDQVAQEEAAKVASPQPAQSAQPAQPPTQPGKPAGNIFDQVAQEEAQKQNQSNPNTGAGKEPEHGATYNYLHGIYQNTVKPIADLPGDMLKYYYVKADEAGGTGTIAGNVNALAHTVQPFAGTALDLMDKLRAHPKDPAQVLKDALKDPEHPITKIVSSIIQSHIQTAQKAWENQKAALTATKQAVDAARRGDFESADAAARQAEQYQTQTFGYAGATALPVLGPAAANAGEDIGEGRIAEGLGKGTGLIASVLAPHAISEVSDAVKPVTEPSVEPQPGIVKQVLQGEKVAQPQAQEALRTAAKAGSKEGGLTTVQPQSLRELASEPIDSLTATAKASYKAIDDAAGTDFKALNEKLENTEYQLRQLTETEEDLAKEAQLEKSRQGIIDKIAEAKQAAIDNGVDPKLLNEADQQFTQARALKDVEAKVFKNPNVVKGNVKFKTPETVDVDTAIKTLQKLQDNEKYGAPRLEQALGKEGANGLLNDLYEAQRTGQKALKRQQFAKMVAKYALPIGGLAYGGHVLHTLGGE